MNARIIKNVDLLIDFPAICARCQQDLKEAKVTGMQFLKDTKYIICPHCSNKNYETGPYTPNDDKKAGKISDYKNIDGGSLINHRVMMDIDLEVIFPDNCIECLKDLTIVEPVEMKYLDQPRYITCPCCGNKNYSIDKFYNDDRKKLKEEIKKILKKFWWVLLILLIDICLFSYLIVQFIRI